MWLLWLVFALLVIIAVLWLLRPLFKTWSEADLQEKQQQASRRKELNIELFRQKQAQIEQDFAVGLIDEDGYKQAQNEIEHSLLHEVDETEEPSARQLTRAAATTLSLGVLLFIPVLAVATYLFLKPDNLQQIVMAEDIPQQSIPHAQAPDIDSMIASLEQKLQQNPDNLQGWMMLGRSYSVTQKYDKAIRAYAKAIALDQSNNTELIIDYTEALMQTGQQTNYRQAHQLLEELLVREPDNADALWFIGMLDYEFGDQTRAAERWNKLLTLLPVESEEHQVVANYLARLQGNTPAVSSSVSKPAPEAKTQSAPVSPVFTDKESEQAFINSMIARVEQRVKDNPKDLKSWKMLGKSYAVQQRYEDSAHAYAKAIGLEGNNVQLLMDYTEVVLKTGDNKQINKARQVFSRLINDNPEYTDALYLSGSLARAAGDQAEARELWTKLLTLLTPGTPAYNNVEKNLNALN